MLYQDYKAKINRRVKIRRILRKYRVPIICTLSAIVMLLTAFAITKGMIFGDSLESNKIEYGNKPSFTANAVFSDVRYEFCKASGGEWSTEVPVHMGEYKMRVVANGLFGERFSEEQGFSIVPRNIYVVADEKTVAYGEKPTASASMAFEDKVYCGDFVFDDTTKKTTTVTPVKETVVIKDKSGKDVTHCYNITVKPKSITFTPRSIEITVESKDTVYDGKFFSHEVWDVTGGSLAYGDDVIKVVENSFASIKGVGSTENKGEFYVERNGVDVTHHYSITQIEGTLTINKRPVVIITPDKEYYYTGAERYDQDLEFTVSEDTPLAGEGEDKHEATISDIIARLTTVGEIENKHEYTIRDSEGNNVTDNYSITHVTGKLRVIKRPVTVKTANEVVPYTGQEYAFEKFDVTSELGLAVGHSFRVIGLTKATNAVEALENVMELDIVDGNGESVIKNYDLSFDENGTITIERKKIEITSVDLLDGIYNGKPQGAETATYDEKTLVEGHVLKISKWSSVTDCLEEPVDNDFNVTILGENQEIVTDNYEIVKHLGKLQLKPLTINILTNSADKIYDGQELSAPGFTYLDGSPEFVKGHKVECVESTVIVNAEAVDNEIKLEISENGVDKSFNYVVNATPGVLRIDKRSITVSSKGFDSLVYYDGEQHRHDGDGAIEVTSELGVALVDGHEVRVKFLESSYVDTAVADVENRFNVIGVFIEGTETSVTKNYAIDRSFGTLHLEKRPVAFGSGSMPTDEANRVIYDNQYHTFEECFALPVDEAKPEANMGLVSGHAPFVYGYSRIIDAEEIDNFFEVADILDSNGKSVFGNYMITGYKYGKLKVFPRPITLISGSDEKVYDGTALTKTDGFRIGGEGLLTAQYLDVTSYASITDVLIENGQVVGIPNTFEYVIRWEGNDAAVRAENFIVTDTDYGTLTITKRPITVTTYSAEKVYDGKALSTDIAYVTSGLTADNQIIKFADFATLTDVMLNGDSVVGIVNSCSYQVYWTTDGNKVDMANYEITEDFGELLVKKRPAVIKIESSSKEYDGEALTPNGIDLSERTENSGILMEHSVEMTLTGEITKVDTLRIQYSTPKVVFGDADKTSNYEITVVDGYLTITKRHVGIEVNGDEEEYTGDVIDPVFDSSNVYHTDGSGNKISGTGLGLGDVITVEFKNAVGPELGLYKVEIDENSIVIRNNAGEDVTGCYDIHKITSEFVEVIKRRITVNILGGYKEYYDGAPVVSQGYEVYNFLDSLHTITMTIVGEQTDVTTDPVTGEKHLGVASLKSGSVKILDKSGGDASGYYEIVEIISGSLEVEKRRPVKITSEDAVFPYTGSAQSHNKYIFEDLCNSPMKREEEPRVTFNGEEAIIPGAYENSFTVEMYVKGTSQKTTHNYDIEVLFGTIVIGNIEIEVTTQGATKVYDGAPLTNPDGASYICPSQASIPGLVIEIVPTGSQTDVIKGDFGIFGGSKNTYEIKASIDGVALPQEAFTVTKETLGDLIVTPLEIEMHTSSAEGFREDVGVLFGESTLVGWEGSLAAQNLNISVGSVIVSNVDRVKNEPVIRLYDKKTGNQVSKDNYKYSDSSTFGTLTLRTRALITIESETDVFVYDGTPKMVDQTKVSAVNSKHYVVTDGYLEFTDVGVYENTFIVTDIIDRITGESVLDLYPNIEAVPDTVTITPRKITITPPNLVESADEFEILYAPDRIVMPNDDIEALNDNFYGYEYGYEIDWSMVNDRPFVVGLGETLYTIPSECVFITMNGERLPQEFFVIENSKPGKLKLTDSLIEIYIPKYNCVYDGQWHGYDADFWYDLLPEQYRLELDLSGIGRTEVGTIDLDEMYQTLRSTNKLKLFYTDEYGIEREVTDEYDYKFVCDTPLTVNKIELTIVAGSASEIYEQGKTLTCDKYEVHGTLFSGHRIEECVIVGSISGVGREENRVTTVKIVDQNGNDVTDIYKINRELGWLVIFDN